MTGQMRLVMSEREEASLGPQWGNAQVDVRYPPNPAPEIEPEILPPVFSIDIPEAK
jgi:hypothetical protein